MDAIPDHTTLPRMTEAKIRELRLQHGALRRAQWRERQLVPEGHMRAKDATRLLTCSHSRLRRWAKKQPFDEKRPHGFYPKAEVEAEAERRKSRRRAS